MSEADFDFPVNIDDMSIDPEDIKAWGDALKAAAPLAGLGVRAKRALVAYAYTKALAMEYRLKGEIPTAQWYEERLDRIYNRLPNKYRW